MAELDNSAGLMRPAQRFPASVADEVVGVSSKMGGSCSLLPAVEVGLHQGATRQEGTAGIGAYQDTISNPITESCCRRWRRRWCG